MKRNICLLAVLLICVLQSAEHNVPELKTNCEFEHFLTQNKMRIWVIY